MIYRPRVKWLHTDGGGDHIFHALNIWLTDQGIIHELTTPYSPESNGKAERLNRTLLDCARSMMILILFNDNDGLWSEAINTENILGYRLSSKLCPQKFTPYEVIYGKLHICLASRFFDAEHSFIFRNAKENITSVPGLSKGYSWDTEPEIRTIFTFRQKNHVITVRDVAFD